MELEELERLLEEDEDLRKLVEAWLAESGKATDDLEAALEDQELLALLEEYLQGCSDRTIWHNMLGMSKIYLAIDTRQKDLDQILLRHALNGREGWVFMRVHPRVARLLERLEETGFGHVTFDLRDGLPENVNISRRYALEV